MKDIDLFICHECGSVFFFAEDLEDHKVQTGHRASVKKRSTLVRIDGKVIAFFDAA